MAACNFFVITICILISLINLSTGFWFYGYDQVYRDPYSETTNNEIVQTSVITFLASAKNLEIVGEAHPYTYKLILFESIVQYETESPDNEWNLGVWDSFIYCDENENSLCLYFSDGMYCDNGYFRETAIELTCHHDADVPTLYGINEYEECVYTAKLYFPELCRDRGTSTQFLRTTESIERIKASTYISEKGNKINTLPYSSISGSHQIGFSMTINEIEDYIRLTFYGPMDKYFGVGFGSNGMLNTYAIIINGEHDDNNEPVFFEQLLDSHAAGYTLQPSFILSEHKTHSEDNTHQITLIRKLSSSVDIDEYWMFSALNKYIDIIWSVGKSTKFKRHIAFGQDRMDYKLQVVESYDKSQIINGLTATDFNLKINWGSLFIMICLGLIAYYIVKKYKQNIIQFGQSIMQNTDATQSPLTSDNNDDHDQYPGNKQQRSQYGSAQEAQPLTASVDNRL